MPSLTDSSSGQCAGRALCPAFRTRSMRARSSAELGEECRRKRKTRRLLRDCSVQTRATAVTHEDQNVQKDSTPTTPPTFVKASGRIIAIGDLHGDLNKAILSLEVAGVLGKDAHRRPVWTGADTVVVQLGDVLDKGDCEIGLLMLLREVDRQARLVGGALYMLNGNHEVQNAAGDFRYVTEGGFLEAAKLAGLRGDDLHNPERRRAARRKLYGPGGVIATELAKNPTVLMVNDTLFAHGGVMPAHVRYGLERLNAETSAWFLGDIENEGCRRGVPLAAMGTPSAIMRNRLFGCEQWPDPVQRFQACSQLHGTLSLLRARHMVIGHTPQLGGANCACEGRVWRIDVGMSRGVLDAPPQVLEIQPANAQGVTLVRVLQPPGTLYSFRRPSHARAGLQALWDD